jgi:hypothetical protein
MLRTSRSSWDKLGRGISPPLVGEVVPSQHWVVCGNVAVLQPENAQPANRPAQKVSRISGSATIRVRVTLDHAPDKKAGRCQSARRPESLSQALNVYSLRSGEQRASSRLEQRDLIFDADCAHGVPPACRVSARHGRRNTHSTQQSLGFQSRLLASGAKLSSRSASRPRQEFPSAGADVSQNFASQFKRGPRAPQAGSEQIHSTGGCRSHSLFLTLAFSKSL